MRVEQTVMATGGAYVRLRSGAGCVRLAAACAHDVLFSEHMSTILKRAYTKHIKALATQRDI